MKSIYLQKDKSIFSLEKLPAEKFAESLGLPGAPKIKFLNKDVAQKKKNISLMVQKLANDSDDDEEESSSEDEKVNRDVDSKHNPVSPPSLCQTFFAHRGLRARFERSMTVCLKGKTRIFCRSIIIN